MPFEARQGNKEKMRLSQSIVGPREAEAISCVITQDGYLGMGKEVQQLEVELAKFLGVSPNEVVCVSSGTAALHLAIEAALRPGDEVLVQSLTYIASFQAISAARSVPIPCEVLPTNITIDLGDAAKRITKRTRAIMPVHYGGNPGNLDEVYAFAKQYGLRVIEDAAHAFGCRYNGRMIGSFGDIRCFSFDGIKNITSGEGGAIVTSDAKILSHVRDARLLGVEKDTEKRYDSQRSWEFDVKHQGYRYHMSNIFAAIGMVQIERFSNEFSMKRVALARRYHSKLNGVPGVQMLDIELGPVVPHIQPVRILNWQRDKVRHVLETGGIETGIHYKPNHLLRFYGNGNISLPVTEQLYSELLSVPLHPGLEMDNVDDVCGLLIQATRESAA